MNAVLDWVKTNVFTVIFAVVMLVALVVLPIFSAGKNEKVREDAQERARMSTELAQLEKTQLSLPGSAESQQVLVNQRLLRRYEALVDLLREDAEQVRDEAIRHNCKDRDVLLPDLFPEPRVPGGRDVLPGRFYELLQRAYADLLAEVNAGSPPSADELREEVERREAQFRTQMLAKEVGDKLDPEEQVQLTEALSDTRLSACARVAEQIGIYASPEALDLPVWEQARTPDLAELFDWQWQYWCYQDLFRAFDAANHNRPTVIQAPVKRVVSMRWGSLATPSASSGFDAPKGGTSLGIGGSARGRRGSPAPAPKPTGQAQSTGGPDFSYSYTGRKSNALYDVRLVDVDLVIETTQIPAVLDAISRQNFITIIGLSMTPADPYQAVAEGYFYGAEPVSNVTLQLETLWLRAWTT
jgi:hypothetical protein